MPDSRPVLFTLGVLITVLGLAMFLPALVDLASGSRGWQAFVRAGLLTLFTGGLFAFAFRGTAGSVDRRQGFLLVTGAWAVLPFFAALPIIQSGLGLDLTDAYFEAMSGLTTTGATVITGLDAAPPGLLIWRAMLQWLGGLGIIVMAVALLPILQIGGMQLFRAESFDVTGRDIPRAVPLALTLLGLYGGMTFLCFLSMMLVGMTAFDAAAHAMTTIATGGYSTHDRSIAHFNSAAIDWTVLGFMLAASLPFVLYVYVLERRPARLFRDDQVKTFLLVVALVVFGMSAWLMLVDRIEPVLAVRLAAFNTVSALTGTGYATADYSAWGAFATLAFLFIMMIGGCAGSTSCGVKIFRWQVIALHMLAWMRRTVRPHGVFVPHFNGRPMPASVASSVFAFFLFFLISLAFLTLALAATGLDYLSAVSSAVSALANVGPGLGPQVGPSGTFAGLTDGAKWLMSAGMLVGRLELFAVFLLFTPAFWKG